MPEPHDRPTDAEQTQRALELTIRVGGGLLLAAWCLQIVLPFVGVVVWGLVIAVAVAASGAYNRLQAAVRGRSSPEAVLFALVALLILVIPAVRGGLPVRI